MPTVSQILTGDIFQTRDILTAPVLEPDSIASTDRTRPNLKIQDGCHNRCSFCIIPFVRGRSRFIGADDVVAQVRALAATYKEVVLSGINLGRWGREPGSTMRLADLLRRIIDETEIERLRLSSVEPMDFTDDLLSLIAGTPRISKHVHAPLQSGSDAILRRMHRKYRPRHYADRVTSARRLMPDAAIGADVMVGFPGETDALFEESRQFIQAMPFTYLHVFTYSERPGTPAAAIRIRSRFAFARPQSRSPRPGRKKERSVSPKPARPRFHGGHSRSARPRPDRQLRAGAARHALLAEPPCAPAPAFPHRTGCARIHRLRPIKHFRSAVENTGSLFPNRDWKERQRIRHRSTLVFQQSGTQICARHFMIQRLLHVLETPS